MIKYEKYTLIYVLYNNVYWWNGENSSIFYHKFLENEAFFKIFIVKK